MEFIFSEKYHFFLIKQNLFHICPYRLVNYAFLSNLKGSHPPVPALLFHLHQEPFSIAFRILRVVSGVVRLQRLLERTAAPGLVA